MVAAVCGVSRWLRAGGRGGLGFAAPLGRRWSRRAGVTAGWGCGGLFLALLFPRAVGGRGGLRRAGVAAGRGHGGLFSALLRPRAVGGRGGLQRSGVAAARCHGGLFLALLRLRAVGGRGCRLLLAAPQFQPRKYLRYLRFSVRICYLYI